MDKNTTILVATVGQGVMRSPNGGQSWMRAGIDQGMHSDAIVRCLSTDPDRPESMLAGSDKGIYHSTDAGRSWKLLDTPLSGYSVWNIAVDPQNPETVYAGTGTPTPAALFRSENRGQSWQRLPVRVAETCPNVGIPRFTGLAIDPHDHSSLWAGIEVDGVRRSSDGGQTWSSVNGTINNPDVHSVAVIPGPPKTVIVVVNNGTFTSVDNGETWEDLPLPVEPNSAIWALGTHPADPQLVFAGSRYGYLYRSDDGGDSWSKEWREFSEISAIAWVPG
jgi:photosystem II stability/assembly factor-like uncharacterized protein